MKRKTKLKSIKLTSSSQFSSKEMRFRYSLVILSGVLVFSLLLLLIVLNNPADYNAKTSEVAKLPLKQSSVSAMEKENYCTLDDSEIDFSLTMPVQFGEWIYKTGFVKSLTDDDITNHYVQIFVPLAKAARSNNFGEMNQKILTIRKMTDEEWKKLEKGCQNENQFYCESAGKKIGENNGAVYTYLKEKKCDENTKAKCDLADKIIQSFQLKQ